MKRYWLNVLGVLLGLHAAVLHAGLFNDRFPSARFSAMGGSGVAVANDVWAAFYNPAGLSRVEHLRVGSSYLRLFNAPFFTSIFGATAYPLAKNFGTVSLGFEYFGVNYEGNQISGEYTIQLSHGFFLLKDIHSSLAIGYSVKGYYWALGRSLEYGNLGSAATLGLDVGLQAAIYGRTYIGVYLMNVNTPKIGAYTKFDLPQRVVVGMAYEPYDGVVTSLDLNRVIGTDHVQVWGGAEFNLFRNLFLRFGGTTNPNRFSFGIGLYVAQIRLDYALITHNELGETHQIGFQFEM